MKKILLLGLCAAALTACGGTETDGQDNQIKGSYTAPETSAYQMNKDAPMEYKTPGQTDADHLWLEDVTGEKALAKVTKWNERSAPLMQGDTYKAMKAELLEVYNSPEKIPYVSYRGGYAYNFWQDETHVKGIWRRTTLDSYRTDTPQWETILDFDVLAKTEDKNWVYKGTDCLGPDYNRCIVSLSIGGKDATERREFDIATKSFVKGAVSSCPRAKAARHGSIKTIFLVGIDFGAGTMTESGYPMVTKLWTRGTPLSKARELYRGTKEDVGIWPRHI